VREQKRTEPDDQRGVAVPEQRDVTDDGERDADGHPPGERDCGRPMTTKKSSVVSGLKTTSIQRKRSRFSAPRIARVLVSQRAAMGQRCTRGL
jgi:hypothetical protein